MSCEYKADSHHGEGNRHAQKKQGEEREQPHASDDGRGQLGCVPGQQTGADQRQNGRRQDHHAPRPLDLGKQLQGVVQQTQPEQADAGGGCKNERSVGDAEYGACFRRMPAVTRHCADHRGQNRQRPDCRRALKNATPVRIQPSDDDIHDDVAFPPLRIGQGGEDDDRHHELAELHGPAQRSGEEVTQISIGSCQKGHDHEKRHARVAAYFRKALQPGQQADGPARRQRGWQTKSVHVSSPQVTGACLPGMAAA